MKNIKITSKLAIGFGTVLFFALIIGIISIIGSAKLAEQTTVMYHDRAKPLGDLTYAIQDFQELRVQSRTAAIFSGNAEQLAPIEQQINMSLESFEKHLAAYEPTLVADAAKQKFAQVQKNYYDIYKPNAQLVLQKAKEGASAAELLAISKPAVEASTSIVKDLDEAVVLREQVMADAAKEAEDLNRNILILIVVGIIVAVILSVAMSLHISKLIAVPVQGVSFALNQLGTTGNTVLPEENQRLAMQVAARNDELGLCAKSFGALLGQLTTVSRTLEEISDGDLSHDVKISSEHDQMNISLSKMTGSLNNTFTAINNISIEVAENARGISDSAISLAQGATEQTAAVAALSKSIAQVAVKTSESAEMAINAANLGATIKQNAEIGSREMDSMMDAVRKITEASASIGKVIKVIDDIAFQTNILALNAAVEAARAGQHGKGFAVVAEEVRNLAAKSADAARETGALIANSIEKAELGAKIASSTSASLSGIVAGINESSRIVNDIAQSSEEQTKAIMQINQGIDQVGEVVRLISSGAELAAKASTSMSEESENLHHYVAQFKLKNKPATFGKTPEFKSISTASMSLSAPTQEYSDDFGDNKYL